MEALTRLVADSLARHGLDRPVDPRRLQWSRWFRCDSPHSLLVIPSKPGIFALAEEVGVDVARAPSPAISAQTEVGRGGKDLDAGTLGGAALQRCDLQPLMSTALAAEVEPTRRMLAVLQFSEDDDMAFTLDRMFTRINPMRSRLASGRCFVRFVVINDQDQRRSICTALNQWLISSAEKASGLPSDFCSSLEVTDCVGTARVGRTLVSDSVNSTPAQVNPPILKSNSMFQTPYLDSGAARNLHCPHSLPAGF
jgi:hypothetical protein